MVEVKVCGVRTVHDARLCVALGASAVGLNFWPGTPRCVDVRIAKEIVSEVGGSVEVVGVFVDQDRAFIEEVRQVTGLRWVQLHGGEDDAFVRSLLPNAYKAVRVRPGVAIPRFSGARLLVDSFVKDAMPGGTGHTFAWDLVTGLADEVELTLAGGLTPRNVADAIETVRPARVDVASGVELRPGVKDRAKVEAFLSAVRAASVD